MTPACAHMTLNYRTEPAPQGGLRGFWECKDCKTRFSLQAIPMHYTPFPAKPRDCGCRKTANG